MKILLFVFITLFTFNDIMASSPIGGVLKSKESGETLYVTCFEYDKDYCLTYDLMRTFSKDEVGEKVYTFSALDENGIKLNSQTAFLNDLEKRYQKTRLFFSGPGLRTLSDDNASKGKKFWAKFAVFFGGALDIAKYPVIFIVNKTHRGLIKLNASRFIRYARLITDAKNQGKSKTISKRDFYSLYDAIVLK